MQFYESVVSSQVASYMRCLLVWVIRISTRWLQHGGGISRQEEGLRYSTRTIILEYVDQYRLQTCCVAVYDAVVLL